VLADGKVWRDQEKNFRKHCQLPGRDSNCGPPEPSHSKAFKRLGRAITMAVPNNNQELKNTHTHAHTTIY